MIKKTTLTRFPIFVASGLIYVIIYFVLYKLDYSTFAYCIGQVILASILLSIFFARLDSNSEYSCFSIVDIMIWMVLIYYYVASIKYPTIFFYEYNSDPSFRFWACFIVFIACLIPLLLCHSAPIKLNKIGKYNVSPILIWGYIAFLAFYKIISPSAIYGTGKTIVTSEEILSMVVINSLNAIFLTAAVQQIKPRDIPRTYKLGNLKLTIRYRNYLSVVCIIFIYLYGAILTGQRSSMFLPLFQIITLLLMSGIIKVKTIVTITAIVPIAYIVYSSIVFAVSGRLGVGANLQSVATTLGYRCDLADFPNQIAANAKLGSLGAWQTIKEGFLNAVPSFLGINKATFQRGGGGGYDSLMQLVGLGTTDYGSSVFAMGASVGGYIGIIFSLFLLVIFEQFVERVIVRHSNDAVFYLSILAYYFIQIEIYWTNIFSKVLWAFLSITLCWVALYIFKRFKLISRKDY